MKKNVKEVLSIMLCVALLLTSLGIVNPVPVEAAATTAYIYPTVGGFDIAGSVTDSVYGAVYNEVTTSIVWGTANAVSDIKVGGVSIGASNFSVSGNTLTIKSGYLSTITTPGVTTATITFTGTPVTDTNNATLTLYARDFASVPTFNPASVANARKSVNQAVYEAVYLNQTGTAGYMWQAGNKYYDIAQKLTTAVTAEPYRVDLRHNLINANILGNFFAAPASISAMYDDILGISPNDSKALFYSAFYKHLIKTSTTYGSASVNDADIASILTKLEAVDPGRAKRMKEFLTDLDDNFKTPVVGTLTLDEIKAYRQGEHVGIFTLGNALNPDGTMTPTLRMRLEQTLKLATLMPESKIVVSGGVPKAGNSEGILMKQWLIENGVNEERIIAENHSTTTVSNMTYSLPLLRKEGITDVLLVSSGTHVRRAEAILKAACVASGVSFNVKTFAFMDKTTAALTTESVSMIYSNALSAFGECSINLIPVSTTDTYDYDPEYTWVSTGSGKTYKVSYYPWIN